jgi:hypothetical protein
VPASHTPNMEILFVVLQVLFEIVFQIVVEGLIEFGLWSMRSRRTPRSPIGPVLAALGYVLIGALAGGLSLLLFPSLMIRSGVLRVVNLVLTPLAAGAAMAGIGAWRRRRGQLLLRLDHFSYGAVFALSMALVRFVGGR